MIEGRYESVECPDCGHHHTDITLAGICIGCPCETRAFPAADAGPSTEDR